MNAIITNNGKSVKLETGEIVKVSKQNKKHNLPDETKVSVYITNEYPETCDDDPFCFGDETCIQCLVKNKVALIENENIKES